MTILVVDDEPKIANGLQKLLSAYDNWQVAGAFGNAAAALHFLQEAPADVMITDIRMPDMSGLDLIRAIRRENREMEIIILSGHSDFSYAQTAIELGVRRYLTKPTNTTELVRVLSEIETELAQKIQSESEGDEGYSNRIVDGAIAYIRTNYARKITLRELADALHVSPNYLCRLFKAHTGKGITDYLTQHRMAQACSLLKNGSQPVTQVAALVGFADAKYFSAQFKRMFGITPLEYRNGKAPLAED